LYAAWVLPASASSGFSGRFWRSVKQPVIIVVALAASLIIFPGFSAALGEYGEVLYGNGSGDSDANAINIDSPEAFLDLMYRPADWGKHFIQTQDLDFSGIFLDSSIGYYDGTQRYAFTGTYDGNDKAITNLFIGHHDMDPYNNYGIFGYCSGSTIKNLTIANVSLTAVAINAYAPTQAAVLVARQDNGATVLNCSVDAAMLFIHQTPDIGIAGMIIGYNEGRIIGCNASGSIQFGSTEGQRVYIGGVVGQQFGDPSLGYTQDSNSTVSIYSDFGMGADATYVGGICGFLEDYNIVYRNYLSHCHWSGTIDVACSDSSLSLGVGGVAGRIQRAPIYDCSSAGTIRASSSSTKNISYWSGFAVGGVVGLSSDKLERCYSLCSIDVNGVLGAFGGAVGYSMGGLVTMKDSYFNGSLKTRQSDGYVGGFAGLLERQSVDSCHVEGNIEASSVGENSSIDAGGFVGHQVGGRTVHSYSHAGMYVESESEFGRCDVGGFAGRLTRFGIPAVISQCYSDSVITVSNWVNDRSIACVAGFCGWLEGSTIDNSHSRGSLYDGASGGTGAPGFACGSGFYIDSGNTDPNVSNCLSLMSLFESDCFGTVVPFGNGNPDTVSGCFWDIDISQLDEPFLSGAIGASSEMLQDPNTLIGAGWDLVGESDNGTDDIWRMPAYRVGYPLLAWQRDIGGDIAGDYGVDGIDYAALVGRWGDHCHEENGWCSKADIDKSGVVDFSDLSILALHWMEGK
jgi:hypothetical protein